jgi:hypothetical protein
METSSTKARGELPALIRVNVSSFVRASERFPFGEKRFRFCFGLLVRLP